MNGSLLEKCRHAFVQHPIRNACAKFEIDRWSHFCTGVPQAFTTQKSLPSRIHLTMKTATSNSF